VNWRRKKITESIKTSLFQKIISFLIWGGLFVCIGILQSRYYRSTFINAPINLISASPSIKANTFVQVSAQKPLHLDAKNKLVTLNHWDSIYHINNKMRIPDMTNAIETYSIELNIIDSAGLESLPGIGPYTANKIVKYRERLGGYLSKFQLLEIPYIDSHIIENPKLNWSVNPSLIQFISLDSIDPKQLYRHPYIGKSKTRNLIEYQKVHGSISRSKFLLMKSLNSKEKERLLPYLKFN